MTRAPESYVSGTKALGICEFKNLARFDSLQAYYSIAGRDLEREIVPLLESVRFKTH